MQNERWLLPEGIDEALPPQAAWLEKTRRDLLDLLASWGYELVIPPFIEYLDSLLTGTGRDLELQTFKLTDQLTGRLMGIRADMTPQVARVDAHRLRREAPSRLCYLGTVLRTRTDGFAGCRSPLQFGAELYGHGGVEADVEILRLMLRTLVLTGIDDVYLDLGHVGIFRGLARQARLDPEQEGRLFDALQRKSVSEIEQAIEVYGIDAAPARMLAALSDLNGDDALERASSELAAADESVHQALSYLDKVAAQLHLWLPEVPVHFDLAELRGYHYKTGVVFAAFVSGLGQEIARGGRYDDIGAVFGRARPAVGFSADLRTLQSLSENPSAVGQPRILAPWSDDSKLGAMVEKLRAQGNSVIYELPGQHGEPADMGCSRRLIREHGEWQIRDI